MEEEYLEKSSPARAAPSDLKPKHTEAQKSDRASVPQQIPAGDEATSSATQDPKLIPEHSAIENTTSTPTTDPPSASHSDEEVKNPCAVEEAEKDAENTPHIVTLNDAGGRVESMTADEVETPSQNDGPIGLFLSV